MDKIKNFLSALSFNTGLIVLGCCVVFYIISFAQMLLPLSLTVKSLLWIIFFGLAKAAQYSALLILGKTGFDIIKKYFKR